MVQNEWLDNKLEEQIYEIVLEKFRMDLAYENGLGIVFFDQIFAEYSVRYGFSTANSERRVAQALKRLVESGKITVVSWFVGFGEQVNGYAIPD